MAEMYNTIGLVISTPLELKNWANTVNVEQHRLKELITRVLNSPNFKDYIEEEEGKKQILVLTMIYDPSILTFKYTDILLATGIYKIFSSLLEQSLHMEIDSTDWLEFHIKHMSQSNIEIELYF